MVNNTRKYGCLFTKKIVYLLKLRLNNEICNGIHS